MSLILNIFFEKRFLSLILRKEVSAKDVNVIKDLGSFKTLSLEDGSKHTLSL